MKLKYMKEGIVKNIDMMQKKPDIAIIFVKWFLFGIADTGVLCCYGFWFVMSFSNAVIYMRWF